MVNAISIDKNDNIWFSKKGYGISKFDGNTWTTYSTVNSNLPSNFYSTITIDNNNNKWFGDEFEGRVIKYNDTIWEVHSVPNPHPTYKMLGVTAINIDFDGNAWIEVPLSGVFKFDGTNWSTILGHASVYSLVIDIYGYKWVGYQVMWIGGGISKFDGNKWTNYDTDNSGIIDNWVTCIVIDKQGNKWIGTRSGVSVFNH
jgi:ligand-binding sensor domain-containing protein